jgi:hypothetical protein
MRLGCKQGLGVLIRDSGEKQLACVAGFGCHSSESYLPGLVVKITVFVVCDVVYSGGNLLLSGGTFCLSFYFC